MCLKSCILGPLPVCDIPAIFKYLLKFLYKLPFVISLPGYNIKKYSSSLESLCIAFLISEHFFAKLECIGISLSLLFLLFLTTK